jgi:Protein of unknown function (DUF2561)
MVSRYSAYRRGPDTVSPEAVDRILLGACTAVWLVLIGVSVAAAVALSDLAGGYHKAANSPHTTWVLYVVIGVSALIIAGAIPVLVRARRNSQVTPVRAPAAPARPGGQPAFRTGIPTTRAPAERPTPDRPQAEQALWPPAAASGAEVDRIWLRGAVALTGTIGLALVAAGTATYLMAVGEDTASWVCYGVGGLIAAGLPAIEWVFVRQIRGLVAEL